MYKCKGLTPIRYWELPTVPYNFPFDPHGIELWLCKSIHPSSPGIYYYVFGDDDCEIIGALDELDSDHSAFVLSRDYLKYSKAIPSEEVSISFTIPTPVIKQPTQKEATSKENMAWIKQSNGNCYFCNYPLGLCQHSDYLF